MEEKCGLQQAHRGRRPVVAWQETSAKPGASPTPFLFQPDFEPGAVQEESGSFSL